MKNCPQVLVEATGSDSTTILTTLVVCTAGKDLFIDHLFKDHFKGKCDKIIPFNLIAISDSKSPNARLYEVEYTLEGRYGYINRALIQAIDPVIDLPFIFGSIIKNGLLPNTTVTHKAYLRSDIEAVSACTCQYDSDENPNLSETRLFESCHSDSDSSDRSLFERILDKSATVSITVINEASHELQIGYNDQFDVKPIFVSGSRNVWDDTFAEMRNEDMSQLQDHIEEAIQILDEYGMQYIIGYETEKRSKMEDGSSGCRVNIFNLCTGTFLRSISSQIESRLSSGPEHPCD